MTCFLDKNKGIEIGGIIGGVISGILLLIIIAIVVIFLLFRHRVLRIIPKSFVFKKSKKFSIKRSRISRSNYQNKFQLKQTNEQTQNTVNSSRPVSEPDVYEMPVSVAPPYSGKSVLD